MSSDALELGGAVRWIFREAGHFLGAPLREGGGDAVAACGVTVSTAERLVRDRQRPIA